MSGDFDRHLWRKKTLARIYREFEKSGNGFLQDWSGEIERIGNAVTLLDGINLIIDKEIIVSQPVDNIDFAQNNIDSMNLICDLIAGKAISILNAGIEKAGHDSADVVFDCVDAKYQDGEVSVNLIFGMRKSNLESKKPRSSALEFILLTAKEFHRAELMDKSTLVGFERLCLR